LATTGFIEVVRRRLYWADFYDLLFIDPPDYYTWYQNATLLHKKLLHPLREGGGGGASQVYYQNAKLNYMRVAREISSLLSESLVKFDYGFIALGLALTTAVSSSISFKVFVIL